MKGSFQHFSCLSNDTFPQIHPITSKHSRRDLVQHIRPRSEPMMARPQPHGYRRKRYREGSDGEEEIEEGQGYPKAQALPIADLPDDFDGVIEDGATYLAVAV